MNSGFFYRLRVVRRWQDYPKQRRQDWRKIKSLAGDIATGLGVIIILPLWVAARICAYLLFQPLIEIYAAARYPDKNAKRLEEIMNKEGGRS